MVPYIYALIALAAAFFVVGAVARFVRHHEGTVWWRGAMGLLAFANTLLLLEIYWALTGGR
jgi:hypothetical protein